MEEFDHHIKSKIDSLHKVPGVEFDEERIWKRIKPSSGGCLFFFIGLILLLTSLIIIFLPKSESQREIVEDNHMKESMHEIAIDSNSIQTTKELQFRSLKIEGADSVRDFKSKPSKLKNSVNQLHSIHRTKKVPAQKQSTPQYELISGQVKEIKKEFSVSVGRGNQTIGITHVKEVNNHVSLTYGIQFNRNFNQRVKTNEHLFRPFEINQIQIPLGVRYSFFNGKRKFQPHVYAGFTNSFLLSSDSRAMDYTLKFESNLVLDYRIFSTKDGKKAYLGFRLPIYNKNIINQGVYKPSLYDLLKH